MLQWAWMHIGKQRYPLGVKYLLGKEVLLVIRVHYQSIKSDYYHVLRYNLPFRNCMHAVFSQWQVFEDPLCKITFTLTAAN